MKKSSFVPATQAARLLGLALPLAAAIQPLTANANFRCEARDNGIYLVSSTTGSAVEGWGFSTPEKCRTRLETARAGFVCTKFNEGEYRAIAAGTGARIQADGFSTLEKCTGRVAQANSGFLCGRDPGGNYAIISSSRGEPVAGDHFSDLEKCLRRVRTARDGFVCTRDSSGQYQIISAGTGQWIGNGTRYSTIESCAAAL